MLDVRASILPAAGKISQTPPIGMADKVVLTIVIAVITSLVLLAGLRGGEGDQPTQTPAPTVSRIPSSSTPPPTLEPTPLPTPPATATASEVFSPLRFCTEQEFDQRIKRCTRSRQLFTGVVERLFVSWTPSKSYKGATFLKKWYLDGNWFLDSESRNEYAYLEVETRPSLKPGKYNVEVYVAGDLIQSGSFRIR
jgi:hypothetical protein